MRTILLVEDNRQYANTAIRALEGRVIIRHASDYDGAIREIQSVDDVITDVFFRRNPIEKEAILGQQAIERIRYGLVKDYVEHMSDEIKKYGVECDATLIHCLETIKLHRSYSDKSETDLVDRSILRYISSFKETASPKLEQVLKDMMIEKGAFDVVNRLFKPLTEYISQSIENQPLGYLIAEESEKAGKRFVLATSLRHGEQAIIPVLKSCRARRWKILEGNDGSKDSTGFWEKAYETLIKE